MARKYISRVKSQDSVSTGKSSKRGRVQVNSADLAGLLQALKDPYSARPGTILQLQRLYGNRAVGQMFAAAGKKIDQDTSGALVQRKAKVDDFSVNWVGELTDDNVNHVQAGFDIAFDARFANDDDYDPEDAEFHQYASNTEKTWRPDHDHENDPPDTEDADEREDDGYSRENDPEDYNDEEGTFHSTDMPGFDNDPSEEGDELENGEYVEYTITLDQEIVDTDRNVRLAYTDQATGEITGTYPNDLHFERPEGNSQQVHYTDDNDS